MPMIRVLMSESLNRDKQQALLEAVSTEAAELLDKPESYMMVIIEQGVPISMSASVEPAAFVDVRSVGSITEDQARNQAQHQARA